MDCINTAEIIKMLRWIQQDLTMRRILWPRFGETPIEMDLTLKVTNDLAEAIFGDIFDSETDLEYYTQAVYDALGTMQAGYLLLKRQWGGSRSPRGISVRKQLDPYFSLLCELNGDAVWDVEQETSPPARIRAAIMHETNAPQEYSGSEGDASEGRDDESDNNEGQDQEENNGKEYQDLELKAKKKIMVEEADQKPMFFDIPKDSNLGTSVVATAGSSNRTFIPMSRKRARSDSSEEIDPEIDVDIRREKRLREMRREQDLLDIKTQKRRERLSRRQRKHEKYMINSQILLARINKGLVKE